MGAESLTLALAALSGAGTIIGSIIAGAAIYGGIRADLRHLHESVNRAHERLDSLSAK